MQPLTGEFTLPEGNEMKKSMKQLKNDRNTIKREVVEKVTNLFEQWALRSLTASSNTEAMEMLFLWFAYAWGGRLLKHDELSADTLTELVVNEIIKHGNMSEEERFRQCEALTSVWRSWNFMACMSWSENDARSYWHAKTRTLHPSSTS